VDGALLPRETVLGQGVEGRVRQSFGSREWCVVRNCGKNVELCSIPVEDAGPGTGQPRLSIGVGPARGR